MKELYDGVTRSVASAQDRRGKGSRRWSPPSGDQVRALRERLGLSQSEFAEEFALDLSSLKNWEQNRSVPEKASAQLFWMIDADPQRMREMVQKATEHEHDVTHA